MVAGLRYAFAEATAEWPWSTGRRLHEPACPIRNSRRPVHADPRGRHHGSSSTALKPGCQDAGAADRVEDVAGSRPGRIPSMEGVDQPDSSPGDQFIEDRPGTASEVGPARMVGRRDGG